MPEEICPSAVREARCATYLIDCPNGSFCTAFLATKVLASLF